MKLVLLMEEIYAVCHWDDLRWHDIRTKFLDDQFRFSINIKVITSTMWEVEILVWLMGGIYEVRCWDCVRWNTIHTTFYGDRFRHSRNIMVIASTVREAAVLLLLIQGIYDGLRWHDIHTKFSKYRFRRSEFVRGDTQTNMDTHTKRARRFHKLTLFL
jgi:hypothetical protein